MDRLAHNNCIIGKSFEYWQKLYDKGIIEKHVFNFQLAHLNYAIDQGFINEKEYIVHHSRITLHLGYTNQYSQSSTNNYKPHTLMDFGKLLKIHSSKRKQDINKSLKMHQYFGGKSNTEQSNTTTLDKKTSEDILQTNEANYQINSNKELDIRNYSIKKPNKSRKRCKKRKKINNTEIIKQTNRENNCTCHIRSIKQNDAPKDSVQIFIRPDQKKYERKLVNKEPIGLTKNKAVRELFSKILKQFKEEKRLKL